MCRVSAISAAQKGGMLKPVSTGTAKNTQTRTASSGIDRMVSM